jgi:hypothetical protein
VGPGFAGFAATRLMTRIAATQVAKYRPELAKHAGAVASIGSFIAAYFLAHRVKWLAKYQQPIVVGAAIAAIQSLIQLYIPKLGWMVSDATPEIDTSTQPQMITAPNGQQVNPADLIATSDDPNAYTYNDSYDAGRMSHNGSGPGGPAGGSQEEDLLADLDLTAGQPQNMGIFNN